MVSVIPLPLPVVEFRCRRALLNPARKKAANFAAGDLVDHKVFGRGKVLKVTPVAGDCIVEIQFDRVGIKKTMANYAPLTKLTSEE